MRSLSPRPVTLQLLISADGSTCQCGWLTMLSHTLQLLGFLNSPIDGAPTQVKCSSSTC